MEVMEIYEKLAPLASDPEAFEKAAEEIWEREVGKLSPELKRKAKQLRWTTEATLRKYKNPTARLNAAIDMFFRDYRVLNAELQTQVRKLI